MKRRNFLKIVGPLSVTPMMVNGHTMLPFANARIAQMLNECEGIDERVLVLIQLKGGNDGLSTIIPINQYDRYAQLRPNVRVMDSGPNKYINLDDTLKNSYKVGLHPKLTGLKSLYDEGMMSVIQGVGYEDINQSHFKGTDIWLSGGDGTAANFNLPSGWMGRTLQAFYPNVMGMPTANMPDPLGIQVGGQSPSTGFHTEAEHLNAINLSGQDPSGFFSLIQTIGGAPLLNAPDSDYGDELRYIMNVEQSTNLYAERITTVFNNGSNIVTYPSNNKLGDQLKTIARLVKGGSKTKIFLCNLSGFDTHSAQVLSQDATQGDHAELMSELSSAVKAFFDDLAALGIDEKVMACTFSEFGRCAAENGSAGTDHGTLAPMLLFGKTVKPGVYGENVNLNNLTNDNQLQGVQHDYRQVFSTIIQDFLGGNEYVMEQSLFSGFSKLPLVGNEFVVSPQCYYGGNFTIVDDFPKTGNVIVSPNPANTHAEISIHTDFEYDALISVHSLSGRMIYSKQIRLHAGNNSCYLDAKSYSTGQYVLRVQNTKSGAAIVRKFVVAR